MTTLFPRIIHLSDIHVSDFDLTVWNGDDTSKKISALKNFLESRKDDLNAEIIIHTGDLTDDGAIDEYKKTTKELTSGMSTEAAPLPGLKNFYSTPGNHDYIAIGTMFFPDSWYEFSFDPRKSPTLRKDSFKKYIGGYNDYPRIIPVNGNPETGWIILLDSMAALYPTRFPASGAKGELGAIQLNKLEAFLNDPQTLTLRDKGARIIVALHHHPFPDLLNPDILEDSRRLLDDDNFSRIISGKIDVLLFGHQTNGGLFSEGDSSLFQAKAKALNIPIISCVNLEDMSPSSGKIVVIDIEKNVREIYDLAGGLPLLHGGVVPVKPRVISSSTPEKHPALTAAAFVGTVAKDPSGVWFYPVTVSACSCDLDLPKKYTFEIHKETGTNPLIFTQEVWNEPSMATADFNIIISPNINKIFSKVSVSDNSQHRAEYQFDITLPELNASLNVKSTSVVNRTEHHDSFSDSPAPDSIVRRAGGVFFRYRNIIRTLRHTISAHASNAAGSVSYLWSPEPQSGQGTSTAIYEKPVTTTLSIKVTIKDEAGREDFASILLAMDNGVILYIPDCKLPDKARLTIPIGQPITINSRSNHMTVKGVKIYWQGDPLKEGVKIKIGNSQHFQLLQTPKDKMLIGRQ